ISAFSPESEAALRAYDFPGNVRELRNIVERAAVLETQNVVQSGSLLLGAAAQRTQHHPLEAFFAEGVNPPSLVELERSYLERLLVHGGGTRAAVARILGVSSPTVQKKIRDYGLAAR